MSESVYAHFIGVGGAGMSGLARVLHERGVRVTGSDLKESKYTRALVRIGVPVRIGHSASGLGSPQVVVVSSAIPSTNPELIEAQARGIEVWPRARMLAHLADGRRTVAIAGTHGKTTTSSMIATMMVGAGLDPTFLVGGEVRAYTINASDGAGEYYVVEADESDGSFMHLDPFVSVITNVEADHLDHYGTLKAVEGTFEQFIAKTSSHGFVVVCGDDERARALANGSGRRVITYGKSDGCDVRCGSLARSGSGFKFSVTVPSGAEVQATTSVPGTHNVLNATAALATAYALGLDLDVAAKSLAGFRGVKRRFDRLGSAKGVTVVDDYAHHPTEVKATLEAARTLGYGRIVSVFQPHRYSRTEAFRDEFGSAFLNSDLTVVMDVYSAGEAPIPGVSGKSIVDAMLERDNAGIVAYLPHRSEVVSYVSSRVRAGDLVLTMGAGDVTALGPLLLDALACQEGASS